MKKIYLRSRFFWWKSGAKSNLRLRYHKMKLIYWHKVPRKTVENWERDLKKVLNEPEIKGMLREITMKILEKHSIRTEIVVEGEIND